MTIDQKEDAQLFAHLVFVWLAEDAQLFSCNTPHIQFMWYPSCKKLDDEIRGNQPALKEAKDASCVVA